MTAQVLLQGRLLGGADFLPAAPADRDNRVFEARSMWLVLIGEAIPRALLAELQLPALMLGASGGDRFVVVLPDSTRAAAADAFLNRASDALGTATGGRMRLAWSATENLGDWTIIRKRLQENIREGKHAGPPDAGFFEPFIPSGAGPDVIPRNLREAGEIGWSFDFPALIATEPGGARWPVGSDAEISVPRHAVRNGDVLATTKELARRSKGLKLWGVLRGEIDDFGGRMRRAQSVEEYAVLSTLYKQRLAGDIQLLCSQGDYFQRVTLLESAGAGFAVYGAWDALAGFARELQAAFASFAGEDLRDLPGGEAKTITMALTVAEPGASLARTYEECGRDLEIARAADKDCLHILGRVLEWKQLKDAAELKDAIVQINEDFRGGRHFLAQLRNLYKKVEASAGVAPADQERLVARALRFQRRFARVATRKEREFQKLRSHLMKEMAGRNLRGKLNLRPEGLIALEWARLAED
jgi:CRISPR-associated protein Csm1